MQAKRRKRRWDMKWSRIPRTRRHVYVYVLLLLGAIVGNNISQAISGASDDVSNGNARSQVGNMKDRANLLYR
jgi:hypothetical protein